MTDLRDKIAATIYCHILFRALDQCECGAAFDGFCGHALDAYAAHVADAVIRELGLEQEDGECGYCQAQLPRQSTGCTVTDNLRDRKTVGELVAELSKFPPDMPVMVYDFDRDDEWIPDPVVKVAQVQLTEFRGITRYVYPNGNRAARTTDIVSIQLS